VGGPRRELNVTGKKKGFSDSTEAGGGDIGHLESKMEFGKNPVQINLAEDRLQGPK